MDLLPDATEIAGLLTVKMGWLIWMKGYLAKHLGMGRLDSGSDEQR